MAVTAPRIKGPMFPKKTKEADPPLADKIELRSLPGCGAGHVIGAAAQFDEWKQVSAQGVSVLDKDGQPKFQGVGR